MSNKESTLSVEQEIQVARACEEVWQGIAFDIPENSVTASEMVELSADASRLELNDFSEEQVLFSKMVSAMGYSDAVNRVADRCHYDAYEAGGCQAL